MGGVGRFRPHEGRVRRWIGRGRVRQVEAPAPPPPPPPPPEPVQPAPRERDRPPYPSSGDPNVAGEAEIRPIRCPHCDERLPWHLIKGWPAWPS